MIGDKSDFYTRIRSLIPSTWFNDTSTVLNAVITGLAEAAAFSYSLYSYAKLQTRIKTATDVWLDIIAFDFFGLAIQRKQNQSDASFLNTININLFRERGTRNSVIRVLQDLTGRTPLIFEPQRPLDTGAYGLGYNLGYGVAGGYGSMSLPFQAFVTAFRPLGSGIPNVAGYGLAGTGAPGGYGAGQIEYASLSMILTEVTDSDIYAAIDSVDPVGSISWTQITN